MARNYYGSKISENIIETPEGYIICKNAPLGRIGWMDYKGSELPPDFNEPPNGIFKVLRKAEEVFSSDTLASFEGKPVTNTHPMDNLTIDSVDMSEKGHIQNVHRDGDFLVGDLYIKDGILKNAILNDIKREISCGYDCAWIPIGEGKYEQKQIIGNHVAIVTNGRAGHRVRIKDSAPDDLIPDSDDMIKISNKRGGKNRMGKITHDILTAMGFQCFVKDANPEEVSEALDAIREEEKNKQLFNKEPGDDKAVKDEEKVPEKVIEPAEKEPVKDEAPDAMQAILAKLTEMCNRLDQLETTRPTEQTADDALTGLGAELEDKVVKDADAEVPAESMDEESESTEAVEQVEDDDEKNEFNQAVADKVLKKFVNDMKPEIMKIKDEKTRNSLAKAFVTSVRDARQVTDGTGYGTILQAVNKNKKTAMDKGIEKYQTPEERAQIYVNAWKARGQEMSKQGGNL